MRRYMGDGPILEGPRNPVTSGVLDRHDVGGVVDEELMISK
jgi:hypothetical protein